MDMESSFDWDAPIEEIFGITVLVMDRTAPDVSVRMLNSDTDVAAEIGKEFGESEYLQLVVMNHDEESKDFCPYFRIIMDSFMAPGSAPVNFYLKTFYDNIGMSTLNACVGKAMVVGLCDLIRMERTTSVPIQFAVSKVAEVEMPLNLDSSCLKACGKGLHKQRDMTLCDIAGLYIPYHIPWDAQWRIVSYLRSPVAEKVDEKIGELCLSWDLFLWPMFLQREPRIPCQLASLYGVASVQSMIRGATRSFLAPTAQRRERYVVSA
jgi:hypothetical protein